MLATHTNVQAQCTGKTIIYRLQKTSLEHAKGLQALTEVRHPVKVLLMTKMFRQFSL